MSSLLGIGEANVMEIETDHNGCMIPECLENEIINQIAQGNRPLIVVATLGTTVRGSFDPLVDLANICEKFDIWLHADAAWGGGVIFSRAHRHLINGIERTNSVAINPHKLLGVPQQCSLLLIKEGDILNKCHTREAQYLFQKDKFYDTSYDCGDRYVQCGRRCDVFKLFLMWKAKGSSGFEKHVDIIMENSKYLAESICQRPDFELVSTPQFINVCFWYIPPTIGPHQPSNAEYNAKLHSVRQKLLH